MVAAMTLWPSLIAAVGLAAPALANTCGTVDLFQTMSPAQMAQIEAAEATTPYPTGLLWKAERDGQTVTVVGTMHIPDPRLDDIVAQVEPALTEADLLVIEATSEDEQRMAALAVEEPEFFFLTEGPSLIDLLGDEDWALAAERFEAVGVPPFLGAKFQPWYAGMVIGIPPCATLAMAEGQLGLDRRLERLAEAEGLSVVAIEDGMTVLRSLKGDDLEKSLDDLRFSLRSELTGAEVMSTTIEAYFAGRIAAMWELGRVLSEQEMPGEGAALFDGFSQGLLVDRNQVWEADLPALIGAQDVVIAVGAAHLPGETGVLRSLERMGFRITPLP
jgi:uncharacterized protein YbaP (TraB family)